MTLKQIMLEEAQQNKNSMKSQNSEFMENLMMYTMLRQKKCQS